MENFETMRPAQMLLYRVFAWMAAAVGVSGVTAIFVAQNPTILTQYPIALPLLLIGQIVVVLLLSWRIMSLSYGAAQLLFLLYSIMTGATLSFIFAVYTTSSIAQVFFIAASMFATMAIYGAYTKTDLTKYRSILFMTLVGVVIAMLVNIFMRSSAFDFAIAIISVFLFSALTAFDIQNIQKLANYLLARDEDWNKIALLGALQLYLDFVNLFLSLLTLFGKRRD